MCNDGSNENGGYVRRNVRLRCHQTGNEQDRGVNFNAIWEKRRKFYERNCFFFHDNMS